MTAAENDRHYANWHVRREAEAALASEVERREQAEAELAKVKQESARVVGQLGNRAQETQAGAGEAWRALDAMVLERDALLALLARLAYEAGYAMLPNDDSCGRWRSDIITLLDERAPGWRKGAAS